MRLNLKRGLKADISQERPFFGFSTALSSHANGHFHKNHFIYIEEK
jgi:hypothetical protein